MVEKIMKSSDPDGTLLEDNSEEDPDSESLYIGQKESLSSKLTPESPTTCKDVENTVLNVEKEKDVSTVLEDYMLKDTDVLKDVQEDTLPDQEHTVKDVKDTAPNVEMPNIVLNVSSQDTYGTKTVLDHAQEDMDQRMVSVLKSNTLGWKNSTEESSKTLTETLSSELDSGPSMIITSDMPWEEDTSITSERSVIVTIG